MTKLINFYSKNQLISFSGKHQGRQVAWMDSGEKEVTLWQQMLDRPNFWVEGAVHLRAPEKLTAPQN